jgi:hypothetical protein
MSSGGGAPGPVGPPGYVGRRTVTLFVHEVPDDVSAAEMASVVTFALVDRVKWQELSVTHLPPRENVGG